MSMTAPPRWKPVLPVESYGLTLGRKGLTLGRKGLTLGRKGLTLGRKGRIYNLKFDFKGMSFFTEIMVETVVLKFVFLYSPARKKMRV